MVDVSVVMPCLNEEKTVGICVKKAIKVFKENNIDGEVIVADNGSADKSAEVARKAGARIVFEERKGYGSAYLKGLSEAKGKYIIVADSDNTYDLLEIPKFLKLLMKDYYDFVIGTRLKGKILPYAMPWLHKYIGNPVLTKIFRVVFHANITDMYCGMRGFTREAMEKMDLRCVGMEFAPEMIIKALKNKLKMGEVPITLHPSIGREPKIHSFRDGWRALRLIFLFAPNWLFLIPGTIFLAIGLFLIFTILNGPLVIGSMQFDIHPIIFGAFLSILGLQIIIFGLQSKIYSKSIGLGNESRTLKFIDKHFTLEKGTVIGLVISFFGIAILIYIFNTWLNVGFVQQIKLMLVGMTLIVLGIQIIFSSWFLSMIGIEKR
ncbi:MAG: glycosyltransferase family 2 protein [Candidatus Altarchaeum sp.]|nr:glycosyltransferase family 2 protein [Candidatus Altarchaeum sp.]